jgi:hypothetical protein
MTNRQHFAIIDHLRSAQLPNGYLAALLVDNQAAEYLALVDPAGVGRTAMFDPTCAAVLHEHEGAWQIPEPAKPTDKGSTDLGRRVMRWPT